MADNIDPQNPANPNPQDPPAPPQDPPVDDAVELRKQLALERQKAQKAERDLADAKAQGLKTKEDWKGLAEINENRAKELEAELTKTKSAIVNDAKIKALTAEAVKAGINPVSIPDLELLDFSEVLAETQANGRVTVSGAQAAIANLKRMRPNWFTGDVPNVNPSTPQGGSNPPNANVSLDQVLAAQAKYEKSKSDSDKATYYDLLTKYKAQK